MDACDGARDGQIDWVLQPERGGVDDEHGAGSVGTGAFEGVGVGVSEGVADRAELEADQVIEAVAPVRRGGEPDPVAGGDGADGGLERGGRDVVALIDDDLAVGAELVGEVGSAGECLQSGDVDDAGELGSAAAELPRFEAEEVGDLAAPLVGERLAVDQHERGNGSLGDDGTGHDGLPRAGRSDQESQLVRQHRLHCFLLLRPEIEGRREIQGISGDSLIVDLDLAAGSLDESRRRVA